MIVTKNNNNNNNVNILPSNIAPPNLIQGSLKIVLFKSCIVLPQISGNIQDAIKKTNKTVIIHMTAMHEFIFISSSLLENI